MSEEKVNAKLEQAGGKIKEGFGKVTGDKSLETEGKVDQAANKIKEVAADAKDAVKGFVKGLKQDK
ncbi:CsbD family protein [Streptococcus equi]|uniref:CsbD family protein n=1 Tax=Streptococcus equi TaxID=1336 RepID=UPI00265B2B06|nr:CsbD family protein [Streptococcus equi]WKF67334.1 CsbD family protein [Streptococcus equi subsp. zooepidemicus]